jgi:hypothetical protein
MARTPKPLSEARDNLAASVPLIKNRYMAGVDRADWEAGAGSDAAEANYAAGVQEALASKSRQAGVRKAGNARWKDRALTKGANAIAAGVTAGLPAYQENFGPIYDAILSTVARLPARTRDIGENIANRVAPVALAAREASKRRR